MARIYYNLMKVGQWTIENVPVRWKDEVITLLEADVV